MCNIRIYQMSCLKTGPSLSAGDTDTQLLQLQLASVHYPLLFCGARQISHIQALSFSFACHFLFPSGQIVESLHIVYCSVVSCCIVLA